MKDKTTEEIRRIKPVPTPEVAQLQQEVAQLQQDLAKEKESKERATRIAGERQARVEFLENLIDSKPVVQGDAVKEAEELRKRLDELGKQFDAEKKKWEAKFASEKEEKEQISLTYYEELERGKRRAKDDEESFEGRLSIEKRKAAAKAKADIEQLVSTQLEEEKKKWEAKAAADKQTIDEISLKLSEEKKKRAEKYAAYIEKKKEISLMLENERRRGKYERERGDKRAEEDRQRFEELSTQLEAERERGKSKDAQDLDLKRENDQLKKEMAELKRRLEDEIAKNSPKVEPIDTSQDYQMPPLNELEMDFGFKDEEYPNNDMFSEMADAEIPIEDSRNKSNDYEAANRTMYPSDFMDDPMDFNDQIVDDREETATEKDSFDESLLNGMDGIDQSEKQNELMEEQEKEETDNQPIGTPKNGENNGRSSKRISTKRDSNFMNTSDEDDEPSMENSRSETVKKNGMKKRRTSLNGSSQSRSAVKKGKRSDTAIKCPECEFGTQSVGSWVAHIRLKHNTTPCLAGFALLCECGHEGYSANHTFECDVANFTVILKKAGPIQRVDDEKTTPQCILCETYPKTAYGYIAHLSIHHKTTLIANDVYLKCACDLKFHSTNDSHKHDKKCDGRHFSLHKRNEK